MDTLISIGKWIFMYCTDFMINTANLTNTSYYEVNAMVFVVVWPLLTVVLWMVEAEGKAETGLKVEHMSRSNQHLHTLK